MFDHIGIKIIIKEFGLMTAFESVIKCHAVRKVYFNNRKRKERNDAV